MMSDSDITIQVVATTRSSEVLMSMIVQREVNVEEL